MSEDEKREKPAPSRPLTPDQMRAFAAELRLEAKKLGVEAKKCIAEAEFLERAAGQIERLREGDGPGTVQAVTKTEKREKNLKISASMAQDVLGKALQAKGFTLRTYAKRVGRPPSALSQYKSGHTAIPRTLAERMERDLDVPLSFWPRIS